MITPLVLGAISGVTVFIGALAASSLSKESVNLVNPLGAGILLFIAMETGSDSMETVKGIGMLWLYFSSSYSPYSSYQWWKST